MKNHQNGCGIEFEKRVQQMQSQGFGYFMAGIRTSVASGLT